jgi:hypothetical protein
MTQSLSRPAKIKLLNATVSDHLQPLGVQVGTSFGAFAGELMLLLVNTNELAVFSRGFVSGKAIEPGVLYVLDKTNQHLSKIPTPGSLGWARGFGSWVGMLSAEDNRTGAHAASPGKALRASSTTRACPATGRCAQISIDDIFEQSGTYFAGELALYDAKTGRRFAIHTGQGDSEILLIADDAVYYRVNDTIMRSAIGAASLGAPQRIASGSIVPQAHWMFATVK